MNKLLLILLGFGVSAVTLIDHTSDDKVSFEVPEGWPEPIYNFEERPVTNDGFELGRKLFYDPMLSRDGTISCASCHLQYTAFTHVDHSVSHGIEGRKGTRNAPALVNLAWNDSFHWDGGVNHLKGQGVNPIQHPAEMDNSLDKVLHYLNSDKEYKQRFFMVFGDSTITTDMMMEALTQFTVSLVSSNSKYDQVKRGEEVFTEQESNGYYLFQKSCNMCHVEPLFNSNTFASNGLSLDTLYNDVGRFKITGLGKDSLQFRVPTLRNIEFSFPYMHDGRFNKLSDVLNHYTSINASSKYLSLELKTPIVLTEHEKKDLISFLKTLTDKEFLYNQKFSFPR